jgi:hypothetical protein
VSLQTEFAIEDRLEEWKYIVACMGYVANNNWFWIGWINLFGN